MASHSVSIDAGDDQGATSPGAQSSTMSSSTTPGSSWSSHRFRDRRRSAIARGDTEFAFYERISDHGYSDSDEYTEDEADQGQHHDDPAGDLDIEGEAVTEEGKGKGKETYEQGEARERLRLSKVAKGKAKEDAARVERRLSLNRRRPVIVLKRDSGWSFSQEAFFSSYQREQYSLCDPTGGNKGRRQSLAMVEDEEDAQPPVLDIYVSQEDSRRILPSYR